MKPLSHEPAQSRARRAIGSAFLRSLTRLTPLTPLALAALASCSSPPPPPPQITVKQPAVAAAPEAPPLTPARWVDSSGETVVGPALQSGTLVLLGGRRALVAKDGTMRAETAPAPEGLFEIIEVPNAKGELRLVGRGPKGIYRFDDPLGPPTPLARSETLIDHIGAGPGLVAVWDYQSYTPRFIDVESGQQKPLPGLPALPARAIAFQNAKEGAAAFEAAGLAVTTDGGASWRLVDDGGRRDALRVTSLRLEQGAVKASVYKNGPSGDVDIAKARLQPMRDAPEVENEAALLKWIRVTERDPLEAAAASGVEAPGGAAVVASHGLLARVDTKTGAIGELVEFAKGFGLAPCALSRSGTSAFLGCTLSEEEENSDFSDPFAVFRLKLNEPKLSLDRPGIRRSGEVEMRTSPSGGVLLLGPCMTDDEGDVCVRQPDGKWATLQVRVDLWRSGVGPLADGRVAFLRGLEEGDDSYEGAPDPQAPGREGEGEGEAQEGAAAKNQPFIVAVDTTGNARRIATLGVDRAERYLRIQSPIEEDEDHTLRLVLADDEGVYAVVQHPTHESGAPQRIPQATQARIHAGRGMALGDGRVMSSSDGGSTWVEAPAPERVREALADIGDGQLEEPAVFSVSEIGAKMDTQLRIGWGQADAAAEPKRDAAPPTLGPRPAQALPPDKMVSCAAAGASQGTPMLFGGYEATKLFFKGKPQPKPAKGKRVVTSIAQGGRAGMLDAVAMLEEQGTDKPGDPPKTWTIRWVDPAEIGAKVRSWTGAAPKGATWNSNIRAASASGGRALFTVRTGSKFVAIRVKPSGAPDIIDIDYSLMPTADVQFGAEKSDVMAWIHDNSIVVWLPGELPRAIANIGGRAMRTLGQPTKDGVPVLLSFVDLALVGTLPIPAMPKASAGPKAKGAASAAQPPPPVPISLDGWAPVANVVRRDVTRLPACAAKVKGSRFIFTAKQLNLSVDELPHQAQDTLYEAVLGQGDACISSLSAIVAPAPRTSATRAPAPTAVAGKPGKPAAPPAGAKPEPLGWLRVDLTGKRAEGGERGYPGSAKKLTCSLSAKQ